MSADAALAHDGAAILGDIAVPTLVIGAAADPFFAAEGYRSTAAAIPDACLVEIDSEGHNAVLDRRREFDGAIREFLLG